MNLAPIRRHRVLVLTGAAALYALLALACTYPQVGLLHDGLPLDPHDRSAYEDPFLNAWILAWGAQAAVHDPAHIFDTNTFWPRKNTLAYSDHMLGYLPLSAPLFLSSGNAVLVHNVILLLTFAASGFGAFLLAREITGANGPALAAGIVYGFCPFRFEEYGHVQVLSTQWVPLSLWCLHRWDARLAEGRPFPWLPYAGLVGFGAMQSLCSTYFALYFPLFIGCFAVVSAVVCRGRDRLRKTVWLLLAPCIWTVLVLPTLLPYARLRSEMGFRRDLHHNVKYSATLGSFVSVPPTNRLYGSTGLMPHRAEAAAFPGFVTFGLAAVAVGWLAWARRPGARGSRSGSARLRRLLYVYLACAAVMAVLALGPRIRWGGKELCWGPYALLYWYVPGFDGLRAPARLLMLMMLCASVVAALGLQRLCIAIGRGRRRLLTLAAASTALLVEYASVPLPLIHVRTGKDLPPVYEWLSQQPRGRVVELPFDLGLEDMTRMYYSTYHWHHLVNGKSGFRPPESTAAYLCYAKPRPALLSFMAEMQIDYVITNDKMMDGIGDLYAELPWFHLEQTFGPVRVFRFRSDGIRRLPPEVRAEDLVEVPRPTWRATANVNPDDARLARDGSLKTYWQTGRNQAAGMAFMILLDHVRPVRLLRIGFGLHADEIPWCLGVRATRDGVEWEDVYDDRAAPDMLARIYRSAIVTPRNPSLELPIPDGPWRAIELRLLTGAHAGWIMAEVQVFEEPASQPTKH